jgi:transposase-like protein
MSRRRTEEEWRGILEEQREQGLSDRECCSRHGTDPSSLKRWRGRLGFGRNRASGAFIELAAPSSVVGELRVVLPNRVELVVGHGWSPELVAALASRLAAL